MYTIYMMLRKIGVFGVMCALFAALLSGAVHAQAPDNQPPKDSQNPVPQGQNSPVATVPAHISTANCDVCGYCKGMTLEQVPDRWQSCRKCVYPAFGAEDLNPLEDKTIQGTAELGIPSPDIYHIYTDFGCLATKPGEFAAQISGFFFSIVGSLSFLFFIYGAGVIATARADVDKLNQGKKIIYGAIAGLIFTLFAVFIIRFIATGIGLPGLGS